jgi:predicted RNA-binding protein with TRAM domain
MARTLESLDPGTPVFAGATRVGEVRAVYSEGDARSAGLVIVSWDARGGDNVAVPATEILSVTDDGVQLIRQESDQYADLAPFDASSFPTMKQLK